MNQADEQHLRLLSTFHYVGAALAGLVPIFGAIYAGFGVAIVLGKLPGMGPGKGSAAFGWLPIVMGTFVILFGTLSVVLNLLTARALRDRRRHTLCLVTSALNCMHAPLGTALGVFTIVVLCRPAVSAAFRHAGAEPSPQGLGTSPGAGAFYPADPRNRGF